VLFRYDLPHWRITVCDDSAAVAMGLGVLNDTKLQHVPGKRQERDPYVQNAREGQHLS